MTLDPDHHHQNHPGGSPPPAAGSVHPRPDDDTPPDSDASETGPVTKSPHTCRILKQTRTTVDPLVYDHPVSPTPATLSESREYPELNMVIGQEYPSTSFPPTLPPLLPPPTPTWHLPRHPALIRDLSHSPRPTTAKPRKSVPLTAPALALDHVPARCGQASLKPNVAPRVAGVNWTANGNLVIHALAPYTASQLSIIFGEAIIEVVRQECGGFSGPAVLELDTPWLPVVVHGIPALPLLESLKHEREDFWFALEQTGNGPSEVKAVRVLCRDDDYGKRETLSICLTFSDVSAAQRLLTSGLFLFGTRCRVSQYRPRKPLLPPH
ncbi:hypothetical protein C8J57DRAFT_1513605 [Mycena rebaudengoi]|nr:hypothetical protein C8J57DRAFT_1513605 [Mycena rebaudengoi]